MLTDEMCECQTYARDNSSGTLFLTHHPVCEKYKPEGEIRRLLERLIKGIEDWASDEDGVHPNCWDAYRDACNTVGMFGRARDAD